MNLRRKTHLFPIQAHKGADYTQQRDGKYFIVKFIAK